MGFKIPDTPEELFRQTQNISDLKIGQWIPFIAVVMVIVFFALTSFYSVGPDEVGIIRKFGKYERVTSPGLHWKLPFNIEKLDKVKVKRIFKEEFGFRTLEAGINTRYSTKNYDEEAIMLTGDLNVLNVTWIVQFKVKDPVKLLFNIRSPLETIRDLSEAVMREVVGDSSVSEALTMRRIEINQEVQDKLQQTLDRYDSGVQIETVKLQDVNPPDKVKPSFNEVNEAKQEREKVVNQSWEAYNKVIPKAKGQASKTISEAEGYALARINKSEGDATRFKETWEAYKEAKNVTRKRLYLEAISRVIPKVGKIYVFEPEANSVLPLLNISEGMGKNE
ncbi:MAG: FtsH protease activity modulator HflK [Candidatus Zapsychrus exili]|nr:FtsH protease activity modulator HflK [Candidatus Zapsychrus exili]